MTDQPVEQRHQSGSDTAEQAPVGQSDRRLPRPAVVGLCDDINHGNEFFVPLDQADVDHDRYGCPECGRPMVLYSAATQLNARRQS